MVLDSPEVQQMMRAPIVLDDEEDEEPLHAGPRVSIFECP